MLTGFSDQNHTLKKAPDVIKIYAPGVRGQVAGQRGATASLWSLLNDVVGARAATSNMLVSQHSVSGVTWPPGREVKKSLHIPKAANSNLKKEFQRLPVSGTPALRPVSHCCPVHSQRHSPTHLSCSVCWPSPWTRGDSSSSSTLSLPRKWVVPVADEEWGRHPCGAEKIDRLS